MTGALLRIAAVLHLETDRLGKQASIARSRNPLLRIEELAQQFGHHLTRFTVKVIVCFPVEFGQIRIHLNDARASPNSNGGQGCSGLDDQRRSNTKEDIARSGRALGAFPGIARKILSKPHDTWANPAAAVFALWGKEAPLTRWILRDAGRKLVRATASAASWTMKATVEVYNVLAACTFVEVVDVLCDEGHFREEIGEFCNGAMGRIRFALQRHATSVLVPAPHDIAMACEG